MNPLGESLIDQEKRPPKCATPYCKTQTFFDYCYALTRNWPTKRVPPDVRVAEYFTDPITPVSHVPA